MFVGVGASRVRDMFEQAKKHAPCIIFIDEIDAVGRHRGAGLGGGHDEREQTLNQLLVEMDGFEGNEGVIVIAATNRPDVLDPALLRPGRFDRQVVVPLPDVRGREQILRVHMRRVPLADDVKPALIARGTPGFSGADLANLVNEAALFAARANKRIVGMEDFERAKDKIMMGAERRSMVMTEDEKRMTAYHEAGHAIVGMTRARARSGPQGHDHPARPRARRHAVPARAGPLQLLQAPPAKRDHDAVRRPHRRRADLRRRMRSPPAPRTTSSAPRRSRATWSPSRACPTSSGRSPTPRRRARCSSAAASRSTSRSPTSPRTRSTRRSAASSRSNYKRAREILEGSARQAARHGRRAHQVRDHRRGAAQGHHGRQTAEAARRTGTRRCPTSRPNAGRGAGAGGPAIPAGQH